MKPYLYNALNAIILASIGLWGYFGSENPSPTALIPVFSGILLLSLTKWMKDENKIVAHIVVLLTLILLLAFIKPLIGSISRNNSSAIIRILIMMIASAMAMVSFIKSFIDVRKNRKTI